MLGFVSVEAGKDVEWRSKEGVPSGHTTRKRIFLCLCLFFACSISRFPGCRLPHAFAQFR